MKKDDKMDFIHSVESIDKADKALEKAKSMEQKLAKDLKTIILPNGAKITSNKQDILNDYIKDYGKL